MEALLDLAAVGGAIVVSLGIALSLEWFALNALLRMMPPRQPIIAAEPDATDAPAAALTLVPAAPIQPRPTLLPAGFARRNRAA